MWRRRGYTVIAAMLAALGTGLASGQTAAPGSTAPASGVLLALSKHDRTLSIVDPATLRITAKTLVGDDPHEVIASADGHMAWVSNYGYGALHTLTAVDLQQGKAVQRIDLGPLTGPHGLAFADGKTWFTAEGAKALGRLDPATDRVDMILGTGQNRMHMIYVSPDGRHIIASNVASGTVSLIDAVPVNSIEPSQAPDQPGRTEWNEIVIPVGKGSEGFDISPDGREIWVGNAGDGTVSIIDRQARKVIATLDDGVKGVNRLKFTLDGRLALLSVGPDLVVIDTQRRALKKRITLGHGSGGILMEPGGRRAFVACGPDNYIAVVDLKTFSIIGKLDVGPEPDGMAWAAK